MVIMHSLWREQSLQSRLLHSRFHRERSGVLLGSLYPLCEGNWKAVPFFVLYSSLSRAILNGKRMYIKSRYFTYFPLCEGGLVPPPPSPSVHPCLLAYRSLSLNSTWSRPTLSLWRFLSHWDCISLNLPKGSTRFRPPV